MMLLMCYAVLAADEDFIEREANLNCLGYASAELRNLLGCFFELGRRDIVARFVSVCKSAATLSLESRIRSVAGALRIALERVNEVSGRTSLNHGQSADPKLCGCSTMGSGVRCCAHSLYPCMFLCQSEDFQVTVKGGSLSERLCSLASSHGLESCVLVSQVASMWTCSVGLSSMLTEMHARPRRVSTGHSSSQAMTQTSWASP